MQIFHGDCREVLPQLSPVDAVVTDPPYGLSFMGKGWDHGVPGVEFWEVIKDAMKPGAHLLAFGGTRTFHRLACAIEDAGFEIRDCMMWVYGTGFPKSLDVSKAIDKAAGAKREVIGPGRWNSVKGSNEQQKDCLIRPGGKHVETAPATDAAKQWDGWGTALKPAWEPIILARKPLEGTVAANVLEHGVGGLNVDACRIEGVPPSVPQAAGGSGEIYGFKNGIGRSGEMSNPKGKGRWPANLIHDGSEEVVGLFPSSKGQQGDVRGTEPSASTANCYGEYSRSPATKRNDSGSAARFFYCAKASKKDRNEGLDGPEFVWYASPEWVNEVLLAQLPEDMARSARRAIEGSTILKSADSAWNTCWCGSVSTDPYHPAIRSIIEMRRSSTIDWRTSNWSTQPHTNGCTAAAFSEEVFGENRASSAVGSSPWAQRTGISPEKDGPSMEGVDLAISVESWLIAEPDVTKSGNKVIQIGPGALCVSTHPTVKPTDLMRYLCRLITPHGGVVLDPFMGSGSTGKAALLEGFDFIGIDAEEQYCEIAERRLTDGGYTDERHARLRRPDTEKPGLADGGPVPVQAKPRRQPGKGAESSDGAPAARGCGPGDAAPAPIGGGRATPDG